MFKKIPGILNFDLFLEILLSFYQILLLNCHKIMEKNNCRAIFLTKTYSQLRLITKSSEVNYYFSYLATFSFPFLLCYDGVNV